MRHVLAAGSVAAALPRGFPEFGFCTHIVHLLDKINKDPQGQSYEKNIQLL